MSLVASYLVDAVPAIVCRNVIVKGRELKFPIALCIKVKEFNALSVVTRRYSILTGRVLQCSRLVICLNTVAVRCKKLIC